MNNNHFGFLPSDFDIFCGLDVDKKSISATFLSHSGETKSVRMPYIAKNLINYVNNHYSDCRAAFAYEAGPTGFGLYDQLTEQGYLCFVASPANIPAPPSERVKTNRLDSKKIAENLRGGQLKGIHVPSQPYRQLRHLSQMRDTFVRQSSATKCRIKSLLLYEGIPFPEASPSAQWSKRVITQLKESKVNEAVRFKLDQLITSLEFFHKNILTTTKAIRAFCHNDEEIIRNIELLQSIPGIGFSTASHLLARIGDWRNLKRVDQIGSFLGLVPRENSTGDDVNKGSITRLGDNRLRNKLIQCAWICIHKDIELREFYQRIQSRHHGTYAKRKAIVAVARKLTTRIFAVLTQQRRYKVKQGAEFSSSLR